MKFNCLAPERAGGTPWCGVSTRLWSRQVSVMTGAISIGWRRAWEPRRRLRGGRRCRSGRRRLLDRAGRHLAGGPFGARRRRRLPV